MKIIVNPHKIEIDKDEAVNEREIDISKCTFEFSEEITNEYVKEAYFTYGDKTYKQIITNNECDIPNEVLQEKGTVELGVVAYLVENEEEIKRYNPSPAYFDTWLGSLKDDAENSEPITPSEMEQFEQALNDGLNEVANVDIDASKEGNVATVSITNRYGETKSVEVLDGEKGETGEAGEPGKDAKINGVNTINIEAGENITLEQEGSTLTISSAGGAGGTSDYTELENKPSINSVELDGNKTLPELGIQPAGNYVTPDTESLNNYYKKAETYTKTETDGLLNAKQNIMQYNTMPTASASNLGQIVQYTGTTDTTYTNGYFYTCTTDGSSYSWEEATVQASSGGDYNYLIANFPATASTLSTTHIIVITSNTNINQSWFNTYKQALIDGINDDRILFPTRIYFALYMPDRIFETIDAYDRTQTATKSVRYYVRDLTGASKDGTNYIYNNNGTITFSISYSDLTSGLTSSNVQLYGAQTITGLKTFNVLPQSSVVPTNNNDLVNKAYVDAQGGGTTLDGYYSELIEDSTYTLSPDTGAGIYVLTNVSGADTTVTIDGAPSDYGAFVLADTDALIVEVNVVEFDEEYATQKVKVTCRSAKQAPVELYYEWDDTEGALVYNHGAYNGVSIFNITDSDISYPDQTSYDKFEAIFDKYVNQNKQVIIIHNDTKYSYFIECYPSGNDKYITAYINENEAYQQQIANTNDYFINNMTFRFTMKYDYNSGQWSNTDRKWVGHKSLASSYSDIYGSDARTPISRESVYEMASLNEYDYSGVYAVGDYVRYENKIYKCNTATTEEDFDNNKWTEKTYLQYLSDVLVGSALGGSY